MSISGLIIPFGCTANNKDTVGRQSRRDTAVLMQQELFEEEL